MRYADLKQLKEELKDIKKELELSKNSNNVNLDYILNRIDFMLEKVDKEIENLEIKDLKGKVKEYEIIKEKETNVYEKVKIKGCEVNLPHGLKGIIYCDRSSRYKIYKLVEKHSGLKISSGSTQKEAIQEGIRKTEEFFTNHTIEELNQTINYFITQHLGGKALNQEV